MKTDWMLTFFDSFCVVGTIRFKEIYFVAMDQS